MLTVDEAKATILSHIQTLSGSENVDLLSALQRVTSNKIISVVDVPPQNNSAMDGYALNSGSLQSAAQTFSVSQRIPAGSTPQPLEENTVARIFTGGILPEGADAVAMQEDCEILNKGEKICLNKKVAPLENVRLQGQDVTSGTELIPANSLIRPQDIGLLASVGMNAISVIRRPKIAILATGNELVEPGQALQSGQIYNSNKFLLAALVSKLGGEYLTLKPAIEDSLAATIAALEQAASQADLILTSGGVSVGEEDHVKAAIDQLGKIESWKIKMKPGKPLVFGHIASTPIIGLPGNPVSSFVTFLLFVAPALRKLQGLRNLSPSSQQLPLGFAVSKAQTRPEFMRVAVIDGRLEKFSNQSSGVLSSTVWADALALIPEARTMEPGDLVEVLFLSELMQQDLP